MAPARICDTRKRMVESLWTEGLKAISSDGLSTTVPAAPELGQMSLHLGAATLSSQSLTHPSWPKELSPKPKSCGGQDAITTVSNSDEPVRT